MRHLHDLKAAEGKPNEVMLWMVWWWNSGVIGLGFFMFWMFFFVGLVMFV